MMRASKPRIEYRIECRKWVERHLYRNPTAVFASERERWQFVTVKLFVIFRNGRRVDAHLSKARAQKAVKWWKERDVRLHTED